MYFLDELPYMRLFSQNKKVYIPIDPSNKRKGSAIMLLTENPVDSMRLMELPYMYNPRLFTGLYIDRNVNAYINSGAIIDDEENEPVNEAMIHTVKTKDLEIELHVETPSSNDFRILKGFFNEDAFMEWYKALNTPNRYIPEKIYVYAYSSVAEMAKGANKVALKNKEVAVNSYSTFDTIYVVAPSGYDKIKKAEGEYEAYLTNEVITQACMNTSKRCSRFMACNIGTALSGQITDKLVNKIENDWGEVKDDKIAVAYAIKRMYDKEGMRPIRDMVKHGDFGPLIEYAGRSFIRKISGIYEATLSAADRKAISDKDYGLPGQRKYPMPDESHVRSAIRFFNHVDSSDEAELARNINKKIKQYGLDVNVGKDNRFSKYYKKSSNKSAKSNSKKKSKKQESALTETMVLSEFDWEPDDEIKKSKVYFTKRITPDSLVEIFNALGVEMREKTAVKISTGEPGKGPRYCLNPQLIQKLVNSVDGTIVECNVAYEGPRHTSEEHWKTIKKHGYYDIAPCDILDEDGDYPIPVENGLVLDHVLGGNHMKNYDSFIILSHFKGHAMGGYGGALKNVAIGLSSADGKKIVHSGGHMTASIAGMTPDGGMDSADKPVHDLFLRSMADANKAFGKEMGDKVVYINVANNISVDCDCDPEPHAPTMRDLGIFASTDPVAVDQAAIDAVYAAPDSDDVIHRIEERHGLRTIEYALELGLGNRDYDLIDIDEESNKSKVNISINQEAVLNEVKFINDKGEKVPKVCPKCGAKVGVFLKGEPVFLCSNKECNKYFGTVPFDESVLSESIAFSSKDMTFNTKDWKPNGKNILFVVGLSGSGKSTTSRAIGSDFAATYIELDGFSHYRKGAAARKNRPDEELIADFVKKEKINKNIEDMPDPEYNKYLLKFIDYIKSVADKNKDELYVIEGIQIIKYAKDNPWIYNYPMIIKGTSMLKSIYNRFKREKDMKNYEMYGDLKDDNRSIFRILSWYLDQEESLGYLRKAAKEYNESTLYENDGGNKLMSLSKFISVPMNNQNIKFYKDQAKGLSHIRTGNNCKGKIFIENKDGERRVVGFYNLETKDNNEVWLQGIEVMPNYQGQGIGSLLLQDAIQNGAKYLAVKKTNTVAKSMYIKHGFKRFDTTDTMVMMVRESVQTRIPLPVKAITESMNDNGYVCTDDYIMDENSITFFNGMDSQVISEAEKSYDAKLKKYLFQERMKNNKAVIMRYQEMKAMCPWITKTFVKLPMYRGYNIFIDLSYYHGLFLKHLQFKKDRAIDMYWDFINRLISSSEYKDIYKKITIFIPVYPGAWDVDDPEALMDYKVSINPISLIIRTLRKNPDRLKAWGNKDIVFVSPKGFFKVNFSTFNIKNLAKFKRFISKLATYEEIAEDDAEDGYSSSNKETDSSAAITAKIVDKIEKNTGVQIDDITGDGMTNATTNVDDTNVLTDKKIHVAHLRIRTGELPLPRPVLNKDREGYENPNTILIMAPNDDSAVDTIKNSIIKSAFFSNNAFYTP